MVSEKTIYLSISHYKPMGANDLRGVASLYPRALIGRIDLCRGPSNIATH